MSVVRLATPAATVLPTATVPVGRLELTPAPMISYPEGLIAFVGLDGQLWLMQPDGRDQQRVTANEQVLSPAWSPDGDTLAYIRGQGAGRLGQAVLYRLSSRHAQPTGPVEDLYPHTLAWSSDGHYLLLVSGTSMVSSATIVDVMTGRAVSRLEVELYAWSPDGKHLAFGQPHPLETPIPIESGDSVDLAVLDIDRGVTRVVLEGSSKVLYFPSAWLPDGRLLYDRMDWDEDTYQSTHSWWTVTVDETVGVPQPAMNIPPQFDREAVLARLSKELQTSATASFSWSFDGQSLVFQAGEGQRTGIYRFDWSMGGQPVRLTNGRWPAWQPETAEH